MRTNHFLEFTQAIFECAPLTVVEQNVSRTAFRLHPVRDVEEVFRHQIELAGCWVGTIHNDQNQPLSVLPTLRLILVQLHGILVTFAWRPPRPSGNVGSRQFIQDGVLLQSPAKTGPVLISVSDDFGTSFAC